MVSSESEDTGAVTMLNSERGLGAFRAGAGDRWLPWLTVISAAMALSFRGKIIKIPLLGTA